MSLVRLALAGLAFGAAAAALAGLVGAVWGWPDALNSFAPVWLVLAWIGGIGARFALPQGRLRAAAVIAAAVAVLVSGAPIVIEGVRNAQEPRGGPSNLTILTFNRWWEATDADQQIALIRGSGADLVTLQEADGFVAVAETLRDLYPHQLFCGRQCNTAILSKRPFLARDPAPDARGPAWGDFLWVRVLAPDGRPATVATVHPFWPIPPWIQRFQRRHIAELAAGLPKDELVLLGDFNLTPWSFAMRRLDKDLAPLTRRTHGLPTFSARWPIPILPLDQVYAAPAWRTVEVERQPYAGSDHYPVLVRLRR